MAIESETTQTNEGVCAKCNKPLSVLKYRKNRKFCSPLCRTRFFALKRYHDIKSSDEYKEKRRIYEKNWRENNREKWNERMRNAAIKYRAKKKLNSNKVLDEGSLGQQAEETFTPVTEGDGTGNVEGADQPSQINTPLNEGLPGQQAGEILSSPVLVGANAGRQVEGADQPLQQEFCSCGHSTNNHSYDPESFDGNLACDICDCKNFKKQSYLENNTAFVDSGVLR